MPEPRRNRFAIATATIAAMTLLITGGVGYLGYFGGPVLRAFPATAPAPHRARGTQVLFL